ncbi:MAG: hypothetical protein HN919_05190 [Verrucomicrobia bacterium]|nr:hypothetical protein [Verrucomicrobiota bacterium]
MRELSGQQEKRERLAAGRRECRPTGPFSRYTGHRNKVAPPRGHLSVWLEEVKLPEAVLQPE